MKATSLTLVLTISLIGLSIRLGAQSQIKHTQLDSAKLPLSIRYEGKFKSAFRFTDGSGEHIVVLTETGIYQSKKFKHEEEGLDAEVFAYHYLMSSGKPNQTWRVYDFIQDCPLDLEAVFLKDTFQVTDLNNDGAAEIWLIYKTVCHGDVSPYTMKLIMYQGQQKFAMRGRNKVQVSEKEFEGGEYTFDKSFSEAPLEFRELAKKNVESEYPSGVGLGCLRSG